MNKERLMKILLAPLRTEKTHRVADQSNQIAFKIVPGATKVEVKHAVEMLFSVKVDSVRTLNMRGKQTRQGKSVGMTKNWKKAYVTLAPGHDIDFAVAEA